MKLLTIKEISEKWGLSERTIRKFCVEERIPEAELIRGIWMIPEDAYKPERKSPQKQGKQAAPLSSLAKQVISQRRRNNHYGIYEHIQVYLTYSSNRMASNRLAKKAVEVSYKKDRIFTTSEDIKVNDIVEARNHFLCVDTILTNAMKPLTQTFINQLQAQLLSDSCKHRRHAPTPVGYRKTPASKKVRQNHTSRQDQRSNGGSNREIRGKEIR